MLEWLGPVPGVPISCFIIALGLSLLFRVRFKLVVLVIPAILVVVIGMVLGIEPIPQPVLFVMLFAVLALIVAFLMNRVEKTFHSQPSKDTSPGSQDTDSTA